MALSDTGGMPLCRERPTRGNGVLPAQAGSATRTRTDETCPAPTIQKLQRGRRPPSTPHTAARRVAAILEFSRPPNPRFARLYNLYSRRVLPWIGGALFGSREAYRYLPESVGKFPTAPELAEDMRQTGSCGAAFGRAVAARAAVVRPTFAKAGRGLLRAAAAARSARRAP